MKLVRFTVPGLLVASTVHALGDVVALPDLRADEFIEDGHAVEHDGDPVAIANPDHNPFGDTIHPAPPDEDDDQAGAQGLEPGRPRLRARQGRGKVAETATIDNPGAEG